MQSSGPQSLTPKSSTPGTSDLSGGSSTSRSIKDQQRQLGGDVSAQTSLTEITPSRGESSSSSSAPKTAPPKEELAITKLGEVDLIGLPDEYESLFHERMTVAGVEEVLQRLRATDKREIGATFTPEGKLIRVAMGVAAKDGQTAAVDMGALAGKYLPPDDEHGPKAAVGAVFTHSHPQGFCLSPGDLAAAVGYKMQQIRAVGDVVWTMTFPPATNKTAGSAIDFATLSESTNDTIAYPGAAAELFPNGTRIVLSATPEVDDPTNEWTLDLDAVGDGLGTKEGGPNIVAKALSFYYGTKRMAEKKGWTFGTPYGSTSAYKNALLTKYFAGMKEKPAKPKATPKPKKGGMVLPEIPSFGSRSSAAATAKPKKGPGMSNEW